MAKDLVPANSQSKALVNRMTWTSAPVALCGIGMAGLIFLNFHILGVLCLAGGLFWIAAAKLHSKLMAVEAGPAESPEAQARKQLKHQFMKLQSVDGCESHSERASDQFTQAGERFQSFDRLLRAKLLPTELTFARYHTAGEQVVLSIMDRLGEVAQLLISIESIRPTEIREKLGGGDDKTLRERLALAEMQQLKASELLNSNEEALTEMDQANAALTDMKTSPGLASTDLSTALARLEDLSKRAGSYSS